ncbi:MAG: SEC-C domain-containing protein, partial [Calditrichaceae bacterium]|nr:SEC-C domain-containing protein [Calditrichaceae bacterium]
SIKNSKEIIDMVVFNNQKWIYNESLEAATEGWLDKKSQKLVAYNKKIKPNEKCPCGSGKKFKKCCCNII